MEDLTYFKKMTADKKAKVKTVLNKMIEQGLTNKFIQAGILAVVSKESDFALKEEASYKNTSNDRIKSIFSALKKLTDIELNALKKDDVAFFNKVYGGKYGNSKDEGYKYRGRGLNQLTFKDNYRTYGAMAKINLVDNPDLVGKMDAASAVLVAYFVDHLVHCPALQKTAYHFDGINSFKTTTDAANAAYNANAGWGKSPDVCKQDKTGGYATTHSRVNGFLSLIEAGL